MINELKDKQTHLKSQVKLPLTWGPLHYSNAFLDRDVEVRDAPNLKILECKGCRLVSLNSFEHIQSGHYENSRMHGEEIQTMESWLQDSELG